MTRAGWVRTPDTRTPGTYSNRSKSIFRPSTPRRRSTNPPRNPVARAPREVGRAKATVAGKSPRVAATAATRDRAARSPAGPERTAARRDGGSGTGRRRARAEHGRPTGSPAKNRRTAVPAQSSRLRTECPRCGATTISTRGFCARSRSAPSSGVRTSAPPARTSTGMSGRGPAGMAASAASGQPRQRTLGLTGAAANGENGPADPALSATACSSPARRRASIGVALCQGRFVSWQTDARKAASLWLRRAGRAVAGRPGSSTSGWRRRRAPCGRPPGTRPAPRC